jgi:hypothetical protein
MEDVVWAGGQRATLRFEEQRPCGVRRNNVPEAMIGVDVSV